MGFALALILLSCTVGFGTLIGRFAGLWVTRCDGEPYFIPQKIPFLGHIIGFMRFGTKYHLRISKYFPLPIYTLPVGCGRVYVVNQVDLAAEIQRRPKIFSFDPLIVVAGEYLAGTSKATMDIVKQSIRDKDFKRGFLHDMHHRLLATLSPGPALDEMNLAMSRNVLSVLDALNPDGEILNLYGWIKHTVSMVSTDAMYGPMNPFRLNPKVEQAFWDYESKLPVFLLNAWPRYMAFKAYRSRQIFAHAFTDYFESGGWTTASGLIKASYHANSSYGISLEDQGRFELTTCIGLVVNTAPAIFWLILTIFSDPSLLGELRDELSVIATPTDGSDPNNMQLSLARLKDSCPLLHSTLKEVLRLRTHSQSPRIVMADTKLSDRYSLKKGSIVQIPSSILHRDPTIWGSDADTLNPRRFMKTEPRSKKDGPAFRAFGGGTTLCPGRHFATMEMVTLMAVLILQFDLSPESKEAGWLLPGEDGSKITTSVLHPSEDVRVAISRRKGCENVRWKVVSG